MTSTITSESLLIKIQDPKDQVAWTRFVRLYAPLLHSYGLRHGLQDADASDLVQDTLKNVARVATNFRYDQSKGSFRGWLLAIARNELRKLVNRRSAQAVGTGDTDVRMMLESMPDVEMDAHRWDQEYKLHMFRWAAEFVRNDFQERTWQAFWRTIVEDLPVEQVARDLEMSLGAIYVARSRVTARIRQKVNEADGF